MSQPDDPPAPEPTGPFYSTWGPLDGPILRSHEPPAIGVVGEPGGAWHIGMAFPTGQVEHRRGPAVTWRLIIKKVELEGRWLCLRREFVKLGDAAEEVGPARRAGRGGEAEPGVGIVPGSRRHWERPTFARPVENLHGRACRESPRTGNFICGDSPRPADTQVRDSNPGG